MLKRFSAILLSFVIIVSFQASAFAADPPLPQKNIAICNWGSCVDLTNHVSFRYPRNWKMASEWVLMSEEEQTVQLVTLTGPSGYQLCYYSDVSFLIDGMDSDDSVAITAASKVDVGLAGEQAWIIESGQYLALCTRQDELKYDQKTKQYKGTFFPIIAWNGGACSFTTSTIEQLPKSHALATDIAIARQIMQTVRFFAD